MPGGNSGLPSVAIDPEVMLEATESVIRNEQLGGTIPSSRRSGHYEPISSPTTSIRWKPYEEELCGRGLLGASPDEWRPVEDGCQKKEVDSSSR